MSPSILEQFRPLVGLFIEALHSDFRLSESIALRATANIDRQEVNTAA